MAPCLLHALVFDDIPTTLLHKSPRSLNRIKYYPSSMCPLPDQGPGYLSRLQYFYSYLHNDPNFPKCHVPKLCIFSTCPPPTERLGWTPTFMPSGVLNNTMLYFFSRVSDLQTYGFTVTCPLSINGEDLLLYSPTPLPNAPLHKTL
jgi:hypothetical protein